jgi:hypothetical protein
MTLAADGIEYDPLVDDPDAAAAAADLHASVHHMLGGSHDLGRLLGEGLSRAHLKDVASRKEQQVMAAAASLGAKGEPSTARASDQGADRCPLAGQNKWWSKCICPIRRRFPARSVLLPVQGWSPGAWRC